MKLDYGSLISPTALNVGLCHIKSPKLFEIDLLPQKFATYNLYLSILMMNIDGYYKVMLKNPDEYFASYSDGEKETILKIKDEYFNLTEEEKSQYKFLDIAHFDTHLIKELESSIAIFIDENIVYSYEYRCFFIYKDNVSEPVGYINRDTFYDITDLILQMNAIERSVDEIDVSKVKNKKTLETLKKLQKGKEKNKKINKKTDEKTSLPNIISAVAAYHNSLNIINIWDLTVYQVYDQFMRMQANNIFDIQSMSVAFGGDSEGKFDVTSWYNTTK